MFLKNYTSNVPVHETISRIERVLIRCGVNSIQKEYGPKGEITALQFSVTIPNLPPIDIRLPSDKDAALKALWLDYVDGDTLTADGSQFAYNRRKKLTRSDFIQQAERTAWKLMQDWVEVQLSLIQMKQAEFHQVFLPYIWDRRNQKTLYQAFKEGGFKALPEPTMEA